MSFFAMFPQGNYDLTNTKNYKLVTDLFRRVKVRTKVLNETSLYSEYVVPDGEKPEITALKHFGDAQLHWVILLTNNITDPTHDWPLSYSDFERYVTDKYANPQGVHHYEKVQSSGPTSSIDYSHLIECNSTDTGAQSVSNYDYEEREQEKKRRIKLMNPSFLPIFLQEFERLISK
jgi:hypothetical protein